MRRIAPFVVLAAALASCDPTGIGVPAGAETANLRFANLVPDANGLYVANNTGNFFTSVGFTAVTLYHPLPPDTNILTITQASPSLTLGVDTLVLLHDRRYTLYGLGKTTSFKKYLATNDTILAAPGTYKIRFIHGIESFSPFTLDFFDDTTTSLTGLTPTWPSLAYGVGSNYIAVDTGVRRIRITKTGLTTTIVDTILPTPIPSGAVVTLVPTNVVGAGAGIQVHVVTDTTP